VEYGRIQLSDIFTAATIPIAVAITNLQLADSYGSFDQSSVPDLPEPRGADGAKYSGSMLD
jgi:hypothetical protein